MAAVCHTHTSQSRAFPIGNKPRRLTRAGIFLVSSLVSLVLLLHALSIETSMLYHACTSWRGTITGPTGKEIACAAAVCVCCVCY